MFYVCYVMTRHVTALLTPSYTTIPLSLSYVAKKGAACRRENYDEELSIRAGRMTQLPPLYKSLYKYFILKSILKILKSIQILQQQLEVTFSQIFANFFLFKKKAKNSCRITGRTRAKHPNSIGEARSCPNSKHRQTLNI